MTPTLPGFKTRDGAIAVPSASGNPHGAISIRDAFIPATALKGMLSSAYEAVTMSRLRIFDKQHKRLYSHRPPARTAQSSYPTFLTYTEGKWEVVFGFEKKELNTIFQAGEDCPQYVGLIDSTAGETATQTLRHFAITFHTSATFNTTTKPLKQKMALVVRLQLQSAPEIDRTCQKHSTKRDSTTSSHIADLLYELAQTITRQSTPSANDMSLYFLLSGADRKKMFIE